METTEEEKVEPERQTPPDDIRVDQTPLLAASFQMLFGLDIDFEEAMVEAVTMDTATGCLLRPGRPARGEESVAARRLRHPLAQLYVAVGLAEAAHLPLCIAHSTLQKTAFNREIGAMLALGRARAAGLITGWVICWPGGRFPKYPTSVRLLTAGGRGNKARCLGELAPLLRQWVKLLKQGHSRPSRE